MRQRMSSAGICAALFTAVTATAACRHAGAPPASAPPAPAPAPTAAAAPAAPPAPPAEALPPAAAPTTVEPAAHLDKLPPMIDRDVIFGDPEIAGAQLSPSGAFMTFRKPNKGVMNIWIKKIDEAFEAARPLTADTARPVTTYFWSEDSKYVLYLQDKGGDENQRLYAVDPTAAADARTGVPPARDLTPYNNVRALVYDVPEKTPGQILIGLNDRDPQVHDVYRLDLATGKRKLAFRNDKNVVSWVADLDGKLRLAARIDAQGGTEILRVDGKRLTSVYRCSVEESCDAVRFHKDGKRVYLITSKGKADLARLILFDPRSKREELVETDPDKQVDFGGIEFSDAREEMVATYYVGDRLRLYPKSPGFARDWELVRKGVPDGDVYFGSSTEDDRLQIVTVTSDVDPGAAYLYDRRSGKVTFLYRPRPKLPVQHLAPMKPIRYKARDGVEIPAYLTVPKGVEPKGLPFLILPHGGPWVRDNWGYDAWSQFLANRGYAVLQPNFRGSTGYGKKFLNLGNKQWGTGSMQHDVSDGVKWAVDQGIADPKRVGILGASYGGFATLAGLAFTPELYAAGVSVVGISSILTVLQTIPPYWVPLKKVFHARVGDPANPADMERLKAQSPLHSAANIKAPLLIIQGANDPRVKKAESDQIVVAMRELGRQVGYVLAPDEGHGFQGRENRLAMFAAIEKFLAQHLGGRAQTTMPPDITERLAKLTVDVRTVKKAEAVAAGKGPAPRTPAAFAGDGLKAATLRYAQKIELGGGKTLEAKSVVTIEAAMQEKRQVWVLKEETESPMGSGTDRTLLDRKTLVPLRRTVEQGPAKVELTFGDKAVKGNINLGGRQMPIDTKTEGQVLADGMPLHQALRTLPLESGYTATLSAFDVMSAAAKPYRVDVKAAESLQVPAGKFDAFRVELTPIDGNPGGSVVWIERAPPRRVLKAQAKMPAQAGGGTATTELVGMGPS